jgi:hypothetical protein
MINAIEKVLLREIAMDPGAHTVRRLKAADTLASDACLYRTDRDHSTEYRTPMERERKFAIRALRSILKSQKPLTAVTRVGIRDRLRCIATGKEIRDTLGRKFLWIPTPTDAGQPGLEQAPQPEQSSTVADIQKFLEEHGGNYGTHRDA